MGSTLLDFYLISACELGSAESINTALYPNRNKGIWKPYVFWKPCTDSRSNTKHFYETPNKDLDKNYCLFHVFPLI